MTVSTIPAVLPILKFFDNNGAPLAYGKLFTYATGTSTKQATYTDSTGNTPNTNPIILNARGECTVFLDSSLVYKFVSSPSTDTDPPTSPINTQDPVGAFSITQVTGNFTTITVSAQGQIAYLTVTGNTIPANGLYLPAANRLGFATGTTARGYIDSNGQWVISSPSASGPALVVHALGTNNTNTIQLPEAGSMIQMARSTDGTLHGYLGSRGGTNTFSLYNDGGVTSELTTGAGTLGLSTNAAQRVAISATGQVSVNAPDSAGYTIQMSAAAANTTNALTMFTQGSMINFARSTDGSLSGFVGSRAGTTSTSIYNSGGVTAEVEVDSATVSVKTNALTRLSVASGGQITVPAPASGNALTVGSATAITAGGNLLTGYTMSSTANFGVFAGSGVPTIVAAKGSLYLRSDGSSTSTRAYIATDAAGTWTNLTTAA